VRATLLLADFVQAVQGKLYILGGGWSITGPGPVQMGIAVKIEVPWDQANVQHTFRLILVDADEQPVRFPAPSGEQPVQVEGQFEVGRPPGLKPGTPLDFAIAVNVPPLPLAPDGRYVWRLDVDGEADEDWFAAFTTRPGPPQHEAE
jgi:hypothetical protein